MKKVFFPLACILALVAAACGSASGEVGAVRVADAWARPGEAGGTSAIYFNLHNEGSEEDALLGASSQVAEHVELHMSMMSDDGTMSMRPQADVPLPAGERVAFEPGGLHIMLIGLTGDLDPGDEVSINLRFRNAGEVNILVPVREP